MYRVTIELEDGFTLAFERSSLPYTLDLPLIAKFLDVHREQQRWTWDYEQVQAITITKGKEDETAEPSQDI